MGAGLCALVAFALFLTDGGILLTRPFWVDEWFTVLVSRRDSLAQVFGDLRGGADGGAGLFHSAMWLLHRAGLPLSPVPLRLLSLLTVLTALLLLYALLRRRVGTHAAVGAVLAVGAHPLVVGHSYEARFYGPWLLCAVLFAWTITRSFEAPSRRTKIEQGIAAALLCSVHFYGVITLVLMMSATLLSRWRVARESIRALSPSASGFVTVALIVPIALGQRRAYGVHTWIADFAIGQLGAMLREFWLVAIPLVTLAVLAVGWWIRRGRAEPALKTVVTEVVTEPGVAAILGLALVPIALAVVSIVGQPSMLSRYATTSALVWAPLVAIALEFLGRTPARMGRLLFVWFWLVSYTSEARAKLVFAGEVDASRSAVARAPVGIPILTPSIHMMYPVVAESLGGTSRLRFLEIPDDRLRRFIAPHLWDARSRFPITERDLARVHAARFGFPSVVPLAAADSMQAFVILGSRLRLWPTFTDVADFAARVYPDRRFTQISDELGLVERRR